MARGDLLTRAAAGVVLLVGVLAVADSVRGCDTTTNEARPAPATTQETGSTTTTDDGPTPQEEAPANWPEGVLDGVLTFVDADGCRIRTIGLASGRERPPSRFVTDCLGFWAPTVGSRLAFGELPIGRFFRIADLGHPRRDFGSYPRAISTKSFSQTAPVWSFDGQRIAWCDSPRSGIEREILGRARFLPFCPIAYTPEGDLAHVEGSRLVVGSRTLLTAPAEIGFAQFGLDGSIAVIVAGRIQRYVNGKEAASADVPPVIGALAFSPDTCMVAAPVDAGILVIPLGCGRREGEVVEFGHAASWSPSGEWLAVAEPRRITFHRMVGRTGFSLVWPADTFQLQWRSD
jgi:WD40-like Beta Propeller Repeat